MTTEDTLSPTDLEEYYNNLFANRYTESDTDFQNEIANPLPSPPCVANWYTKRRNDWGRQGRGRGGFNQSRGNWGHQRDYHDNRGGRGGHYGNRHRSQDRGDGDGRGHYGHRGGRGGFHGDRDRHHDYNRHQGHYQGNRYGDRWNY